MQDFFSNLTKPSYPALYTLHRIKEISITTSLHLSLSDNSIKGYVANPSDSNSLSNHIKNQKGLSIVLLYRMGCPYCRAFIPNYHLLAKEYSRKGVCFASMQFSDDQQIKMSQKQDFFDYYGVKVNTFPSLLFYKNSTLVKVMQGSEQERELDNLRSILNRLLDQ